MCQQAQKLVSKHCARQVDRWTNSFQLFGTPESSTINDVTITGKLTRLMKATMY